MAYAHGLKSQVVNIGIDVMQLVLPRGVSARKYVEAFAHKVSASPSMSRAPLIHVAILVDAK
jgi:hypothetical protein